jgi:DNA repair exonuclease SbcCD ATPase subunit
MSIEEANIKIEKLKQEINPQLEADLESIKKEMMLIEDSFSFRGFGDQQVLESITAGDINQIIDVGSSILSAIDLIYENIPVDQLVQFTLTVSSGTPISIQVANIGDLINTEKDQLLKAKEDLSLLLIDQDAMMELEKRPSNCKIDNCYFLSKFKEVSKKYIDLADIKIKIADVNTNISYLDSKISEDLENMNLIKEWIRSESIIDKVRTLSDSNSALFSKLSVYRRLSDFDFILDRISKGRSFNDFKENIQALRNLSNGIIQYKSLKKVYDTLMIERKANQNNVEALKDLEIKIDRYNSSLESIKQQRDSLKKSTDFSLSIIEKLQNKEKDLKDLRNRFAEYQTISNQYDQISVELNKINQQFKGSAEILQKITDLGNQINSLQSELGPINEQKKVVESQILMLDSYQKDYAEYYDKYMIIDKLKKYSSPTSGGIQTLFMSLYMGKTLDIANQLLGMLFGGQYQLLEYIINEDEFRIPFASNGFAIDDISSGSTSQICMMGMIINLVLLHQASTTFNVARLDEIDGGLDSANRNIFVDILQKIVSLLNIEQLFIISHSCESALSNVDSIQLAPIEGYLDTNKGANIIYTWEE